ncbi:MAG: hypothetical protein ACRD0N_12165 [Acidimicrobiales bacterium]
MTKPPGRCRARCSLRRLCQGIHAAWNSPLAWVRARRLAATDGAGVELRDRLRAAVERRHGALQDTAGLAPDVFDALVVLAAGEWTAEAVGRGWDRAQNLQEEMDEGRQRRLVRLGFPAAEAADLSALHPRNFM